MAEAYDRVPVARRTLEFRVINFVRGATGCYDPLVRVKPGLALRRELALEIPLRQWSPAALDVSDDVCGPPRDANATESQFYCYRDVSYAPCHFGGLQIPFPSPLPNYWSDCIVAC